MIGGMMDDVRWCEHCGWSGPGMNARIRPGMEGYEYCPKCDFRYNNGIPSINRLHEYLMTLDRIYNRTGLICIIDFFKEEYYGMSDQSIRLIYGLWEKDRRPNDPRFKQIIRNMGQQDNDLLLKGILTDISVLQRDEEDEL